MIRDDDDNDDDDDDDDMPYSPSRLNIKINEKEMNNKKK